MSLIASYRRADYEAEPAVIALLFVLDPVSSPPKFIDSRIVLGNTKGKDVRKGNPLKWAPLEKIKEPIALARFLSTSHQAAICRSPMTTGNKRE